MTVHAQGAGVARGPVLPHLSALLNMGLWGTLVPILAVILLQIDPWTLTALRYVLAATLMLGFVALRFGTAWMRGLPFGSIVLLGFGMSLFNTFYVVGVAFSDPVAAIVVGATAPILSAIFAKLVYRIPLSRGVGIGLLLATVGSLAATLGGSGVAPVGGMRGGEVLIALSAISWAWYSIEVQRRLGHLGQLRVTAVTIPASAMWLCLYLGLAVLAGVELRLDFSGWAVPIFFWILFAVTIAGVLLWNLSVAQLGIMTAALYLNLIPLFGILTAAAFGLKPSAWQIAGCALVVLGVLQVQRRPAQAKSEAAG